MILASLVNIQKKRRVEKMPKGTMRRREREHLVEAQNVSGSSQERERPIRHTKNATWLARARPSALCYSQASTRVEVKVNAKVKSTG